ncbi:hypothetical protein HSX11_11175 [Oxalobacteraceae bacterium]|nr:hypothetical protein [Oxalobacteraceae bacterium]
MHIPPSFSGIVEQWSDSPAVNGADAGLTHSLIGSAEANISANRYRPRVIEGRRYHAQAESLNTMIEAEAYMKTELSEQFGLALYRTSNMAASALRRQPDALALIVAKR